MSSHDARRRLIENADGVIVPTERLCPAARHLGDFRQGLVGELGGGFRAAAGGADEIGGHAFIVFEQRLEDVFGGDALVIVADGDGLG